MNQFLHIPHIYSQPMYYIYTHLTSISNQCIVSTFHPTNQKDFCRNSLRSILECLCLTQGHHTIYQFTGVHLIHCYGIYDTLRLKRRGRNLKKSRKAETRKAEVLAEDEASKTSTFNGLFMMVVVLTPRRFFFFFFVRNLQTAYLYHHSEHATFCSRY